MIRLAYNYIHIFSAFKDFMKSFLKVTVIAGLVNGGIIFSSLTAMQKNEEAARQYAAIMERIELWRNQNTPSVNFSRYSLAELNQFALNEDVALLSPRSLDSLKQRFFELQVDITHADYITIALGLPVSQEHKAKVLEYMKRKNLEPQVQVFITTKFAREDAQRKAEQEAQRQKIFNK